MRIARDGSWFYQGSPIERPELVRLFSTILRKDGDGYYLVTPVEKVGISVEDVPFVAVDVEISGEGDGQHLTFHTNVGDRVPAGPGHAIRVAPGDVPYLMVRDGLEARIDRKTFYRLAEIGARQDGWFGLWSGGDFFPLVPSADMPED